MADKDKENMKENKKDAHKSRENAGKNHVTEIENFRKRKYQVGRSGQRCQMQGNIKLKNDSNGLLVSVNRNNK